MKICEIIKRPTVALPISFLSPTWNWIKFKPCLFCAKLASNLRFTVVVVWYRLNLLAYSRTSLPPFRVSYLGGYNHQRAHESRMNVCENKFSRAGHRSFTLVCRCAGHRRIMELQARCCFLRLSLVTHWEWSQEAMEAQKKERDKGLFSTRPPKQDGICSWIYCFCCRWYCCLAFFFVRRQLTDGLILQLL